MMTLEILQRLVEVGPSFINRLVKPGPHCILATSVGQMVLAQVGIAADPYPVEVKVCNTAWMRWKAAGYPGGIEEQVTRGAYLLSNTPQFRGSSFTKVHIEKPWDGHLVLRVPDGTRTWLVDLDLGSFNRHEHDIHLPGGLVAPLADGRVTGRYTSEGTVTHIEYGPLDAPYRDSYREARDWMQRARFLSHVVTLTRILRHEPVVR